MTGRTRGLGSAELRTLLGAEFRRHRPLSDDSNFFEAGFTSAILAEVLVELRGLGLELTLVDLYRYPTIRELAAAALPTPHRSAGHRPPWL